MPKEKNRTATEPGAHRREAVVDRRLVRQLAGGRPLTPSERRRRLAIAHSVGPIKRPEPDENNGTC